MHTIAKAIIALALAGAVMAPEAVNGQSIVKARPTDGSDFHKFLPSLPVVPWLAADPRTAAKDTGLPEAGTVSALMFVPKPAEAWAPLTSRPAALRPSGG